MSAVLSPHYIVTPTLRKTSKFMNEIREYTSSNQVAGKIEKIEWQLQQAFVLSNEVSLNEQIISQRWITHQNGKRDILRFGRLHCREETQISKRVRKMLSKKRQVVRFIFCR